MLILKKSRAAAGQQYAIMVGLIGVVALASISFSGSSIKGLFLSVGNKLENSQTLGTTGPVVAGGGGGGGGGGGPCSLTVNQQVTFSFTGSAQNYAIPSGCTGNWRLEAWGAQGGTGYGDQSTFSIGGLGGYAKGELALTAGESLRIEVGGKPINSNVSAGMSILAGGYNGGGSGWYTNGSNSGGAGGGATDFRRNGTALANRILVAGGGGGGGNSPTPNYDGGTGGGTSGSTPSPANSGAGGNQSSGGAGGGGKPAGTLGTGATSDNGGAGGGGYYGGGAGSYSPGGGGSGYTTGLTNASMTNGNRTGNGQAIMTWLGP